MTRRRSRVSRPDRVVRSENAGNILVKAHEGSNPYSFTYDAANRLVTSIQGASQLTTFTDDNNGNLTIERCDTVGTVLAWVDDNEDQCLNEVRPSGANHTYAYAENGLRWSSQMGGSVDVHNSIWVDDDVINDYVDGGPSARSARGTDSEHPVEYDSGMQCRLREAPQRVSFGLHRDKRLPRVYGEGPCQLSNSRSPLPVAIGLAPNGTKIIGRIS